MEHIPAFKKYDYPVLQQDKLSLPLAGLIEGIYIVFLAVISLDSGAYDKLLGKSIAEFVMPYMMLLLLPFMMMSRRGASYRGTVYLLFCSILVWALSSVAWSNVRFDLELIVYPLYMTWLSVTIAYLFTYGVTFRDSRWEHVATRMAWMLTAVFLYYLYKYSLLPGGIGGLTEHRLQGTLGGAAVIHFLMIPVLAIHLANASIKNSKWIQSVSWAGVFIVVMLIMLTGSRAGLLCMLLMVAIVFFSTKRSVTSYLLTAALGVGIFIAISSLISFERLENLEDSSREMTYATGWKYATTSLTTFVFGNGYGSVWPWYAVETEKLFGIRSEMQSTEMGVTLYHPHSLLLGLLTELGVLSVLAFIGIVIVLLRVYSRAGKSNDPLRRYLALGILCTLPATVMDFYLFKSWDMAVIWWTFLFLAIAVPKERKSG
ncbi:hypothetical protein FE783_21080 [Paenibacillus mesophilus]|uniref:O-antigen ligase family protein n=1 Tax=Paenibacillus mesophilus TaxID=2582849 RepID=UPI00110DA688|nr:hypothetical protein [Paenibacillus mesophilus]TMV47498.1 hypothetical protein FE783_21080 [Paenibacillus mesophilus]